MSVTTPALDTWRDTLPDELKDIRLNLSAVLTGENLQPAQSLGVALAAARFVRSKNLTDALESDIRAGLGEVAAAVISDAQAAAGFRTHEPRLRGARRLRTVRQKPRGESPASWRERGCLPRRGEDRRRDQRGRWWVRIARLTARGLYVGLAREPASSCRYSSV